MEDGSLQFAHWTRKHDYFAVAVWVACLYVLLSHSSVKGKDMDNESGTKWVRLALKWSGPAKEVQMGGWSKHGVVFTTAAFLVPGGFLCQSCEAVY